MMGDQLELVHSGDASDSSDSSGAVASTSDDERLFYFLKMSSIHRAVYLGDLNRVKELIKKGRSPNLNDNYGYTTLHWAVKQEKVEVLEYLLTLPFIKINARNNFDETPLFLSLNLGYGHIALKLIQAGADVTIPKYQDETPLHAAIKNSVVDVAKILIEKGADINAVDIDGSTPLHEAVQCENFEIVCMLLYHGADTSYKTPQGITPFMLALKNSVSKEIQEELFRYEVDINMESLDDYLLPLAICNDSPLINLGADVNYSVQGRTALDMILYSKTPELLFYHILPLVDMDNLLQGDYSLFSSIIVCSYPSSDWLNVVFSLITCDEAQELIEQYLQLNRHCTFFTVFALLFHKKNIPEKELVIFIDICLCLEVDVYFGDIKKVYELYGHNEALSRLLLAEIKDLNSVEEFSFPILFCDMKTNVTDLVNKLSLLDYTEPVIDKILDFCTPGQKFRESFDYMNYKVESEDVRKHEKRLKNRTLPSLIELSRNKTRESICAKYSVTSSREFYLTLRKLELPTRIEDIIICKCPIYYT